MMGTVFQTRPDAAQAAINSPAAIPPFANQIIVHDNGDAFIPHAFHAGLAILQPVCNGIAAGWSPCPEVDGVLLALFAGNPDYPTDESIATTLTREGLRAFIAGLQSIADHLEADNG